MAIILERITTAIPWPRGIVFNSDENALVVLSRGRPRGAGGPDSSINDQAGTLFKVDPSISEEVDMFPNQASPDIVNNASILATPSEPPFKLWNPQSNPPKDDIETDRPYAGLAYDPDSKNYFIGGFSGIDIRYPDGQKDFRKNATDSIHRYDTRNNKWHTVEAHDPTVIPLNLRKTERYFSNTFFPHHDTANNSAPHGFLNGPDGLHVSGHMLIGVAKDNHAVVGYDLRQIRNDPQASAPDSTPFFNGDQVRNAFPFFDGVAAAVAHYDTLYVGLRTTNVVVKFNMIGFGVQQPVRPEVVARFPDNAQLIDLAIDSRGGLYVSCANAKAVWHVPYPDPTRIFTGTLSNAFVELKSKCSNITLDSDDRLYICCNRNDDPAGSPKIAGVVYRAVPDDRGFI